MSDVVGQIAEYLSSGGLFNPELMEHEKVRDLLISCQTEITRLRAENERLRAENEAGLRNTLAMQNAANVLRIRAEKAEAEIERLRAALVRIQNWYPISVANPRWTIKEIQEFAHAAREAKGA